jgi:hypothetical protein
MSHKERKHVCMQSGAGGSVPALKKPLCRIYGEMSWQLLAILGHVGLRLHVLVPLPAKSLSVDSTAASACMLLQNGSWAT